MNGLRNKSFLILILVAMCQPTARSMPAEQAAAGYEVKAPGVGIRLTEDGRLTAINSHSCHGETLLTGCVNQGDVAAAKVGGGGMEFRKSLSGLDGSCALVERFIPKKDSIRWEIEILGAGSPWSTAISTRLDWPATANTRFWTAWSDPDPESQGWHDPLVTRPMTNASFTCGGLFKQNDRYITLPIAMLMDGSFGLSLIMSPEDTTLDASLSTTKDGEIAFTRTNNRISSRQPVRFALDIVPCKPDIRAGLAWMVKRYPRYFDPPNPKVREIAGLGAYSFYEGKLETAKLKQMGFRVNWKASYDFPYMGMFIPPVGDEEPWKPLDKRPSMTIKEMADYSARMRASGFYVLNYFNCNEIGNHVQWPAPPRKAASDSDLWRDPNDFVFYQAGGAWLRKPDGKPTYSWVGCVAADPGDAFYHEFLVKQARLHAEKVPASSGICIDRLDWMRLYNPTADDGVSWVNGGPARFLMKSWNGLMNEIGPIMHKAGKVIFVNPVYKRLDAMREVDGIYDEFGYRGSCLNASSFMALRKPMIAWTSSEADLKPDPDAYFQRHLYMGVFPTAPVPGNDHTINPSPFADKWYLDYGPLFDQLRGRKWVLVPGVIRAAGTKANVFQVPGGYAVPIVFGHKQAKVLLRLPDMPDGAELTCKVFYCGGECITLPAKNSNGQLLLDVPLKDGCAVVRIPTDKVED